MPRSINSEPGDNSKEARRAEAYLRLQVSAEEVSLAPQVTQTLKRAKIKLPQAVEFLRGVDTPEARSWLRKYDEISPVQAKLLPFETFCVAARVSTRKMFEQLCGAVLEQSKVAGQLLHAAAHPAIMQTTIDEAKKSGGIADRKLLLQASGAVPVGSKTVVFGGTVNQVGGNQQNNVSIAPVEDRIKKIGNRFGTVFDTPALPPGDAA